MSYTYDPAKEACDPEFHPCMDCQMCLAGPGGNRQLIENDEKGIQQTGVLKVVATLQRAELGSDHDSYRQGVYTTNSMGDRD